MKLNPVLFLICGLALQACSTFSSKKPAPDVIYFNGVLFTADSVQLQASAIAFGADTIVAVGNDESIKKLADAHTQMVDLQGAFAMPGIIEGHGHYSSLGRSIQNLNLLTTKSWAEIVRQVAQKVQETPSGEWIEGRGWHQEKWVESPGANVFGYPYNTALNEISPDHPVVLYHASGHGLMANAKAIALAGLSKETPDPIGGRIVRDSKGAFTGVFEENAMELIEKPFSEWKNKRPESQKIADFEKIVALAAKECLAKGITSFQDAGSDFWELSQYRRLAEKQQLPVRLWVMASQPKAHDLPKLQSYPQVGIGGGFFTCRAVKCYFDGALGSYGAWLLEPYSDKPDFVGQNTTPIDTILAVAKACKNHHLQLCVHAIGDKANREVLNIFETVAGPSDTGLRWRVEHAQHISPQDIPRFKTLGAVASMQAIHCTSDAPFVAKRLGEARARTGAYVWKSILQSGAHLANGTDAPVEDVDPLPCLYASVTRKRVDSGLEFFPEQCMSRTEALLSYTLWNAWAAFEEHEKGSLTPGKKADMAIFSKNLLTCKPEEILEARVVKTIVGGKVVYQQ